MSQTRFVIFVLIAWVIIAAFAVAQPEIFKAPPQWLDTWTKLIATIVTAAVGARVLWGVPKVLEAFFRHQELANKTHEALLQQLRDIQQKR